MGSALAISNGTKAFLINVPKVTILLNIKKLNEKLAEDYSNALLAPPA